MSLLRQRLSLFTAALWWGSLTALGAWVVPLLFKFLQPTALAGQMAAQLFEFQTHVSAVCAVVLLMAVRQRGQYGVLFWVVGGLLLALIQQWGVAPRIVARENLALWHSVGTALLAAQWVCAGVCLWRFALQSGSTSESVNPESAS
ncbi:MAG: DUF4149 domain-containing protein [Alphaproteobacteria bacterium]|nr:DUF4149 domain-containing protein [Alphaproteobacteria bacterium]